MQSQPSDPNIDITVRSHDELDRRLVAPQRPDASDVNDLADSVRIDRTPRAQGTEREVLRQQGLAE